MIHVWMKGKDYNIYEISVFYGFRLFKLFYKLYSNDDFSSFKNLITEARLARLHAWWWRIDDELCQVIVTKKRIVIWTLFGHEAIHINLSFTSSRKSKDVEIVEAEI